MFGNGEIESEDLNTKNLGIYNVMQDDVADIGFSTVFATWRGSIRETHLHVSSLVPWSTGRRDCRHPKDAAMATPAARAIVLPETNARLFLSVESNREGAARRVVDTRTGKHTARRGSR